MPTEAELAAAAAAGQPTPIGVAGQPGSQPDYKALYEAQVKAAEDWQKRFTGLQPVHQKTAAELADAQTKLHDEAEKSKKAIGEAEALKLSTQTLQTQLGERDGVLGTTKAQLERLSVIATEFPGLLAFEKDGLLPQGVGDDLRAKLTAFTAKLTAQGVTNALPVGITPPAPNGAKPTSQSLMAEVRNMLMKGDLEAYNKAYDALIQFKE